MTHGVERLKELLFDTESETIAEIEQRLETALTRVNSLEGLNEEEQRTRRALIARVDQLFERVGTDERFSTSVATVLDEALRVAEVDNHEEVARAMAPLVVQTIQFELRNSQDELVEVLYPITGRMVKAYVASAMSDLVRQLNRRVEQNGLMLRLRSMVSGRSVAELAITESQHLKVEELYLIRRGSGALVARWPAATELSNSDVHMSGVLSAINDFASHAFQSDGGNLRTFELDDFSVYLRASPMYLVAAKCRGVPPTGIDGIFDEEFLNLLTRLAEAEETTGRQVAIGPPELAPLASEVEGRTSQIYVANETAGLAFSPFKALLFLIAVPLFAWLLWSGYTSLQRQQVAGTARSIVDSFEQLRSYPIELDVGYRGRDITILGLVPDEAFKARLTQSLVAGLPESTKLNSRLAAIPAAQGVDLSPELARLRAELAEMENKAKRRNIQQSLERTARRLAQAQPEFDRIRAKSKDDEQLKTVTKVKIAVERAAREIETYRAVSANSSGDLSTLQSLTEPIHDIGVRIDEAATSLAALVDGYVAPRSSAHDQATPSDVVVAAENLEAQSQRLVTTAIAVSQARLVKPQAPAPTKTARDRLADFISRRAIFFANGNDFRSPEKAQQMLTTLAGLINETTVTIRVAGYTDETGGQNRNNPLAQSRADAVVEALVALGVPRQRLVAVGRANAVNLSNETGPTSANRRVQFEIGFADESQ
ncbi:MAG: OmpA family protein [Hyphomicrobiaceae bacterium]